MELEFVSGILELGTSGLLIWLFLKERYRVTEIMEARIAELHERILWLETRVLPYPTPTQEE